MDVLPKYLVELDEKLQTQSRLERLDAKGEIGTRKLAELNYDELIVSQRDIICDCLREAGLVEEDSQFLHLWTRKEKIDVLFAEIDEDHSFRRFVIVEDKLFRNPEARREVLGQLLEYKLRLGGLTVEELAECVPTEMSGWVRDNEDLIQPCLGAGDFLLLVCGDRIHPRLPKYLQQLKQQLDPLVGASIAMVSMAIFKGPTLQILVPHVVGALDRPQRTWHIRVEVRSFRRASPRTGDGGGGDARDSDGPSGSRPR